jgi:hypothetical protein
MNSPTGFTVIYRNPGHWDIAVNGGRAFRIRGGPGKYLAMDERADPFPVTQFRTITACMSFICDALMHELVVAEGQYPVVIAGWNVNP